MDRASYEQFSYDSSSENVSTCSREHMAPFLDHKEGGGIFDLRSILRMRIERAEVSLTELRFMTETQSNTPFSG